MRIVRAVVKSVVVNSVLVTFTMIMICLWLWEVQPLLITARSFVGHVMGEKHPARTFRVLPKASESGADI
jgi:hypothetical protein